MAPFHPESSVGSSISSHTERQKEKLGLLTGRLVFAAHTSGVMLAETICKKCKSLGAGAAGHSTDTVCRHTWEGLWLCTEGPEQASPMAKSCKYVTTEITNHDLTQQVDKQLLEGPKVQLLG